MIELDTKWGEKVKIFTDNIEQEALSQVINMANSPLGENAHIRIMPDVHAGAEVEASPTVFTTIFGDSTVYLESIQEIRNRLWNGEF